MTVKEGTLLWEPTEKIKEESVITKYMRWLNSRNGISINNYDELWKWSVTNIEDFWESIWDYYNVKSYTTYETVLKEDTMPGAQWFPGATLNYAEHILRNAKKGKAAIYAQSEIRPFSEMSWDELIDKTASVAAYLRQEGVEKGDRVVAYMPNISETVIAFLATASIGAIWSSCAPEFGVGSTLSRFKQIEPKILFTVDGYRYNGKSFNKMETVSELEDNLASIEKVVVIPYLNQNPDISGLKNVSYWKDTLGSDEELSFEEVPFDHPLWILYSSGTTGLPKPIVQGHGGILLSHLSLQGIQGDLTSKDRFFWHTTTGWMLWNVVVGSMLTGSSIVLYDGSPTYPDLGVLWRLAEKSDMTSFGTSPSYILSCMKEGIKPKNTFDLPNLDTFHYTGAPLSPEGFHWVYENVKENVRVAPSSGGTDICAGIVGGSTILPVHAGEIPQGCLGVSVYSYDENGQPVYDEVGEMVITKPFPSMPLFFWNDLDGKKYKESYFDMFPGVWKHGDLLKITNRGSAVIYGRSDATINRMGVRSGSSEIYNAIEKVPEVLDSLVVDLSGYNHKPYMPLFIVLREGITLSEEIKKSVNIKIRDEVSPRHVPDDIFVIEDIPKTLTGKKMEIPIRKILLGTPVEKAASIDAMSNPGSIDYFVKLAESGGFMN
ncbi:acetoacetate--CoA ligase [Virgibacillus sp. NKC19-16]|uniref:acetoacetate--CoA ligase n=1 Tax=Virgibacillus salidurans TaxID=2831673 RepID=UPI001F452290|nr:acetoacetate--CoA ligase [Virgibacillus sp. NKC19-16]UJL45524.1 acetoacetate--CoA ligase [Virgibacillus sp. NKC19-16]